MRVVVRSDIVGEDEALQLLVDEAERLRSTSEEVFAF